MTWPCKALSIKDGLIPDMREDFFSISHPSKLLVAKKACCSQENQMSFPCGKVAGEFTAQ
jgi:hypothetical protein